MLAFILGYTFANYQTIGEMYGFDNPTDGLGEIYPAWSNTMGMIISFSKFFIILYFSAMLMSFSPVVAILGYLAYSLISTRGQSWFPADDFGPANVGRANDAPSAIG